MANIANVRRFNGTSDEIQLDPDTLGDAQSDLTYAAICTNDGAAAFRNIIAVDGTGGEWSFGADATDRLARYSATPAAVASTANSYFTSAMSWCLVAVTKFGGSAVTRFHRYRYDTLAWDHQDDATTRASPSTASSPVAWIGTFDGVSEWWDGDIACIGLWQNTRLSDAEIETLYSGISAWEALSPDGLWLLDQASAATPVTDRIGNADEIAINGTTVVSPGSLTFEVSSAGPPTLRVVTSPLRW